LQLFCPESGGDRKQDRPQPQKWENMSPRTPGFAAMAETIIASDSGVKSVERKNMKKEAGVSSQQTDGSVSML